MAEVYDPAKVRAALQKGVDVLNQTSNPPGACAWHTSQETVDGRVYYVKPTLVAALAMGQFAGAHHRQALGRPLQDVAYCRSAA